MNQPTVDAMLQGLDRLERENRRLKRVAVTLLTGIAALAMMGQAVPKSRIVEAEKFILKDANGRRRAELGLQDGSPGLYIYSQAGQLREELKDSDKTVGLGLIDNGTPRVVLALSQAGQVGLGLQDKDGTARALLNILPNGFGFLCLADKDGKDCAALFTLPNGSPGLEIYDKIGKIVWKAP